MAKKTKTDAAAPERKADYAKIPPAEQRAYVEAVIRKQCRLDDAEAAKLADTLTPEEFFRLHDAGRDGQVPLVREILGFAASE